MNLFRDSRTPLNSIKDKLVTLIYFVIVQCPSVGTTWYSASCVRVVLESRWRSCLVRLQLTVEPNVTFLALTRDNNSSYP